MASDRLESSQGQPCRRPGGNGGAASFPALSITSDTASIEFTPALIAAQDFYPGEANVELVRALAGAQQLYRTDPEAVWPRVSDAIGIEPSVLEQVWEDERFQGTLVPGILDVLEEEEPWVAAQTGRTPRTRAELAPLVDDSVMREALGLP